MLVGRARERALLKNYESGEAKFAVVYGRRRAGKTYLVREAFEGKFFFYFTGSAETSKREHLARFSEALSEHGAAAPGGIASWAEASGLLKAHIKSANSKKRKVVFFD